MSFLRLFSGQRIHPAMVTPSQDESDQSSDSEVGTTRPDATLTPTAQSNRDILNPAQSNSLPQATDYSRTMGNATVMEYPHLQRQQSYAQQYHRLLYLTMHITRTIIVLSHQHNPMQRAIIVASIATGL